MRTHPIALINSPAQHDWYGTPDRSPSGGHPRHAGERRRRRLPRPRLPGAAPQLVVPGAAPGAVGPGASSRPGSAERQRRGPIAACCGDPTRSLEPPMDDRTITPAPMEHPGPAAARGRDGAHGSHPGGRPARPDHPHDRALEPAVGSLARLQRGVLARGHVPELPRRDPRGAGPDVHRDGLQQPVPGHRGARPRPRPVHRPRDDGSRRHDDQRGHPVPAGHEPPAPRVSRDGPRPGALLHHGALRRRARHLRQLRRRRAVPDLAIDRPRLHHRRRHAGGDQRRAHRGRRRDPRDPGPRVGRGGRRDRRRGLPPGPDDERVLEHARHRGDSGGPPVPGSPARAPERARSGRESSPGRPRVPVSFRPWSSARRA